MPIFCKIAPSKFVHSFELTGSAGLFVRLMSREESRVAHPLVLATLLVTFNL